MKKKSVYSLGIFISFFILIACSNNRYYENWFSIEDTWNFNDPKTFTVDIIDTVQPYSFYLNIRNSNEYNFSNIYFFMKTTFPNGNSSVDTIECILADRDGRWLGKGSGSVRENNILLKSSLIFPLSGTYVFDIKQAMRKDNLAGITEVGIRIDKDQ